MDALQNELEKLELMDASHRGAEERRLKRSCICPECPTYNQCALNKDELAFCIFGPSIECIQDELGCTCPDCPVTQELDLKNLYYCTQGSENDLL